MPPKTEKPPSKPDAVDQLTQKLDEYYEQLQSGPRAAAVSKISESIGEVADALVAAAKAGGVQACRLCFELAEPPVPLLPLPFPDMVNSDGER